MSPTLFLKVWLQQQPFESINTLLLVDPPYLTTHHFASAGLGDLHLLEHLVPLLHDQGPLVCVGGDVGVVHLNNVNLGLDPKKINM